MPSKKTAEEASDGAPGKGGRRAAHVRDACVARFTGKPSTCLAFLRDVGEGRICHCSEIGIDFASSKTKAVVYSPLDDALEYECNADLLGDLTNIKVRYHTSGGADNKFRGFYSLVKDRIGDSADAQTVGIYANKCDGSEVTAEDVANGKCWYYVSDEERTSTLPLRKMKSGVANVVFAEGNHPLTAFSAFTCTMEFGEDGVATERRGDSTYVEMILPSKKRHKSYHVRASECPKPTDQCCVKRVGTALHVSHPDRACPGRYGVCIGIGKKSSQKRKAAPAVEDSEDSDVGGCDHVTRPSYDMPVWDGERAGSSESDSSSEEESSPVVVVVAAASEEEASPVVVVAAAAPKRKAGGKGSTLVGKRQKTGNTPAPKAEKGDTFFI